jgi:glycine dehydrogenase subunit 2
MNLIFEINREGRKGVALPRMDVPEYTPPDFAARKTPLLLPEVSEIDAVRHFTELSRNAYGADNFFYPLGSCTMKYSPKINEDAAGLEGFRDIRPLQPEHTVRGCLDVMGTLEDYLCEITGMDAFTLQPAAGAHGEFTGLMLIRE